MIPVESKSDLPNKLVEFVKKLQELKQGQSNISPFQLLWSVGAFLATSWSQLLNRSVREKQSSSQYKD